MVFEFHGLWEFTDCLKFMCAATVGSRVRMWQLDHRKHLQLLFLRNMAEPKAAPAVILAAAAQEREAAAASTQVAAPAPTQEAAPMLM